MTVSIDWQRADVVCGQLLAAFREKVYPYGEAWALPQSFITEDIRKDPLTHARFLFYVCHYMRGSIKSDFAVQQLVKVWQKHPHFFDPFIAGDARRFEEIDTVLADVLKYKHDEITRFWQENSRRLASHWEGDPRRIFDSVTNAADMYKRVTNKRIRGTRPDSVDHADWGFLGFQEKMASMLAYFLMDAKLVQDFSASPPVDFHLIRVMLASRVLVISEDREKKLRYEHLTPYGIEVLETYGRDNSLSLVELGNALWMLSVVLCSRAPGNISSGRKKGENGKKIHPLPRPVDWENPQHRQAYFRTCGVCPLESLCELNVFSGPYYQVGELVFALRKRLDMGELLSPLFGDLPGHIGPKKVPSKKKPASVPAEQYQLVDQDLPP